MVNLSWINPIMCTIKFRIYCNVNLVVFFEKKTQTSGGLSMDELCEILVIFNMCFTVF